MQKETVILRHSCASGNPDLVTSSHKIPQSGRSMVEMLGVLAVTGVLAVVGIMGFQNAMAKTKANRLISDVKLYALQCAQELYNRERHGETIANDTVCAAGVNENVLYALTGKYQESGALIQISAANIPESVCETVAEMGWQLPLSVKIGETVLTADTCGEDNTISFNFASNLQIGEKNNGENDETPAGGCKNNTDCAPNKYCRNGECVCMYPCGDEDMCCEKGYYCSTAGSYTDFSCISEDEESCVDSCEKKNWENGDITIQYCPTESSSCTVPKFGKTCTTAALTCKEKNEIQYCYQTGDIDWWNGKSICKGINMRLPRIEEVKNTLLAEEVSKYINFIWTSSLNTACEAVAIELGGGTEYSLERGSNYGLIKLLCVK